LATGWDLNPQPSGDVSRTTPFFSSFHKPKKARIQVGEAARIRALAKELLGPQSIVEIKEADSAAMYNVISNASTIYLYRLLGLDVKATLSYIVMKTMRRGEINVIKRL
jgi:hypothetical protein